MTKQELRNHPGYIEAMDKIRKYRPGFKFTVDYEHIRHISKAKLNGMLFLLGEAKDAGLIESIAVSLTLTGDITDETFRRTERV